MKIFSVTQKGKPLDPSKYSWDPETKTFSTNENNLVLDFSGLNEVNFKTGWNCTFKTGSGCNFKTGWNCTFKTESYCTFDTGYNCTFKTGSSCTFKTGYNCNFKTGWNCTFKTGSFCTFKTGSQCVVIRRDVFEIIEIPRNQMIKLNIFNTKGFTIVEDKKIIAIDGKDIEI